MRRLWIAFTLVMGISFLVLGWIGTRIYQEMPPLPDRVVSSDGTLLLDEGEIQAGQNVWQSLGGMEVGSVWGHGSYVAPDWTADWLHREATFILDRWATAEFGAEYARLDGERQAQLQGRLVTVMRTNQYDPARRTSNITRTCSPAEGPRTPSRKMQSPIPTV
jgi:nitric oxide reductase subunit B